MSLRKLRRAYTDAYNAVRKYRLESSHQGYTDSSEEINTRRKIHILYQRMNMRQYWRLAEVYFNSLEDNWRAPDPEPIHSLELDFFHKGKIYYLAKKHGRGTALLWKLNNN